MTDPWQAQREALGAFIRTQRQMANLSLRQLAELTSLSNPYLSQVERGLHEPSVRVLKAISDALNVSTETLLAQAGLIDTPVDGPETDERSGGGDNPRIEDVIRADERLSDEQKAALIAVYRSMVGLRVRVARRRRRNTLETGLDTPRTGNLVRVSSVADRDRQPPGRQQVMAERALRGTRLGATSYENDRNTDLAPRQDVPFDCPNGHHFSVPFAAEAELPPMWECRVCGAMATASTGQSPSPKKVKPPRSHWDMLMERRTVEDLEAVLAERLEVIRERRAMEGRAIAEAANQAERRSA